MPRLKTLAPQYAYKDLTKAIKKAMLDRDLRQADLAERKGCSQQNISRLILNPQDMSIEQMRWFVEATGVEMLPVLKALGYRTKKSRELVEEDL